MSARVMSVEDDDDAPPAAQLVDCGCCGFEEECTPLYIAAVRARHGGRWICGLCAEAVKEEIRRAGGGRRISPEEAVGRHARSHARPPPPPPPDDGLIAAVRWLLLRRGLEFSRSAPGTPTGRDSSAAAAAAVKGIARSESCVPALQAPRKAVAAEEEASSGSEYSDDLWPGDKTW